MAAPHALVLTCKDMAAYVLGSGGKGGEGELIERLSRGEGGVNFCFRPGQEALSHIYIYIYMCIIYQLIVEAEFLTSCYICI